MREKEIVPLLRLTTADERENENPKTRTAKMTREEEWGWFRVLYLCLFLVTREGQL